MKLLIALLFGAFIFALTDATAQQIFKWAGKSYTIPAFGNDTIRSQEFVNKYIGATRNSRYDLEIKCTVQSVLHNKTPVVIIRGNKDSLFAESYLIIAENHKFIKGDTSKWKPSAPHILHKRLARVNYVDSILRKLITYNVFGMRDQHVIEKSLKSRIIPNSEIMSDGPSFYTIEIKLNNKYRSFYSSAPRFKYNTQARELTMGENIRELFQELSEEIQKTGQ